MRQLRSGQLNSTKFSTNYLVLVGYCILDRWGTGASRPRCALARDFVNFGNKFHASRARGTPARVWQLTIPGSKSSQDYGSAAVYSCRSTKFRIWIQVKLEKNSKIECDFQGSEAWGAPRPGKYRVKHCLWAVKTQELQFLFFWFCWMLFAGFWRVEFCRFLVGIDELKRETQELHVLPYF